MAFEFRFPDVGEGIHEGTLVEWLVTEGETVEMDQAFVKVETDKAIVELPSPRKSHILKHHFQPGDTINVGDVLVTFGEAGEPIKKSKSVKTGIAPSQIPDTVETSDSVRKSVSEKKKPGKRRPLATPHTRAYARKMDVDLEDVVPTGKGGRITDEDVDKAAAGGVPESPSHAAPVAPAAIPYVTEGEPVERIPVTHLRKLIADNMMLSKQAAAHVTHVDEADVTDLYRLYKKAKPHIEETEGIKFTILPFFIKALTVALKSHPLMNSEYDSDNQQIILKKFYNIGIAVDTADGLVVPVIKHADRMDMIQLARSIGTLAENARVRTLSLDDIRGGTISVTNIGPLGGVFATPIIRQPESAIIGLHTIKDRPAVVDGQIVARKMMYLSVSFDHRHIDGASAARFMTNLVNLIQNPDLLMMRMF
jgi:pyruvate dehydrogenase E2 component (dihydrolipoyllysine-residue acetyltransferase)